MRAAVCTWSDDDVVGLFDNVNRLVHVDLSVSADDLHGLTARCGGGAVPTQDHVGQGAVHSLTREEVSAASCTAGSLTFPDARVYSPHT